MPGSMGTDGLWKEISKEDAEAVISGTKTRIRWLRKNKIMEIRREIKQINCYAVTKPSQRGS